MFPPGERGQGSGDLEAKLQGNHPVGSIPVRCACTVLLWQCLKRAKLCQINDGCGAGMDWA